MICTLSKETYINRKIKSKYNREIANDNGITEKTKAKPTDENYLCHNYELISLHLHFCQLLTTGKKAHENSCLLSRKRKENYRGGKHAGWNWIFRMHSKILWQIFGNYQFTAVKMKHDLSKRTQRTHKEPIPLDFHLPNIHTSLAEVNRRKLIDSGAIHLMGNFPLEATGKPRKGPLLTHYRAQKKILFPVK